MIHDLVHQREPERIATAIEGGADVNAVDENGITPLMIAIEEDLPDCLAVLLRLGANPAVTWPKPVHCSWSRALAQPGGVKLSNLLLDAVDDPHVLMRGGCPEGDETTYLWSHLFKLNRKGGAKLAQRLIDFGLDANERLSTGLTPILIAAHKADAKTFEVIDVLLAAGADPSVSTQPNRSGQRQREAELSAMEAAGQDVSRLPRILPHKPQTVLELARSNGKKTYEYLKSILDTQMNQDRFENAGAELDKIKMTECEREFTQFYRCLLRGNSANCEIRGTGLRTAFHRRP